MGGWGEAETSQRRLRAYVPGASCPAYLCGPYLKRQRARARPHRSGSHRVVVLAKQTPDAESGLPEMPDVEVQVALAAPGLPADDLGLHGPELEPLRQPATARVLRAKVEAASPPGVHPRPRDVQALEVHVRARRAQMPRLGLDVEQRGLREKVFVCPSVSICSILGGIIC